MGAHHGHHHDHGHHHAHTSNNKKVLWISFLIITSYMIVEAIGGLLTNSLALLSDALHMFSDAVSLGIAILAFRLGEKAISSSKTFGYKRFEILAALLNGVTLIVISIFILIEAVSRFANPPEIASIGMLVISTAGLVVNLLVAWIMMRGADVSENLNMRGAYLHVLSDLLGSIGAIIAALLILAFNWGWADPVASIIVAVLVLRSGIFLTKDSVHVLMEGKPKQYEMNIIADKIKMIPGVLAVQHLHIWSITSDYHALSCQIAVDDQMSLNECISLINHIKHMLIHENIQHVTIEPIFESEDGQLLCSGPESHHHEEEMK